MCDCAARLEQIEQRIAALEAKKKPVQHGADWLAELKANPPFKHDGQEISRSDMADKLSEWFPWLKS